ncbi:MAG: hypothetical protein Q9227_006960 [Pyrenula ochraceoflavens]
MSHLLPRQVSRLSAKTIINRQFSVNIANWTGRKVEDHAVNRDGKDVQSEQSKQSMREKEQGKTDHSHGLGQTSGGQNKKAKQEHPEAPEPVIGMNDERGQVCRSNSMASRAVFLAKH